MTSAQHPGGNHEKVYSGPSNGIKYSLSADLYHWQYNLCSCMNKCIVIIKIHFSVPIHPRCYCDNGAVQTSGQCRTYPLRTGHCLSQNASSAKISIPKHNIPGYRASKKITGAARNDVSGFKSLKKKQFGKFCPPVHNSWCQAWVLVHLGSQVVIPPDITLVFQFWLWRQKHHVKRS